MRVTEGEGEGEGAGAGEGAGWAVRVRFHLAMVGEHVPLLEAQLAGVLLVRV